MITIARNEIDIIKSFIMHIGALFDKSYLKDYRSIDGTTNLGKQATNQRSVWEYYLLDVSAYVRQKVTNCVIKKAFYDEVDFLLILDADELIYEPDQTA